MFAGGLDAPKAPGPLTKAGPRLSPFPWPASGPSRLPMNLKAADPFDNYEYSE